jgi:hypothetical protein
MTEIQFLNIKPVREIKMYKDVYFYTTSIKNKKIIIDATTSTEYIKICARKT